MAVADYEQTIQDAAREWNVDPALVKAVMQQETGGNALDQNGRPITSPTGVRGLMQITGATARHLGVTDVTDPVQAIYGGTKYLSQLLDQHKDPARAVYAYNGGSDPDYVAKVAGHYQKFAAAGPRVGTTPPPAQGEADLDAFLLNPPAKQTQPATKSEADLDRFLLGNGDATPQPKPGEIDPITGKQAQFMGMPDNSPVAQSMGRFIATDSVPGPVTQAAINLATDPEQRRRIAASQIFPDLSAKDAQARIFYGPNNTLAAVAPNGAPYYVDPRTPDPVHGSVGNPLAYVASGAGAALPMAGGMGAGLLAAPGSLFWGPAAAAGGAAVGDLARQYGARLLDPSTTPPPINLMQTGKEAALSGVATFGGNVLNRALAPNPLRLSPAEADLVRTGPALNDARDAYTRAGAQGVPLTPGQATGLPSLLQYEDAAATMPATTDMAADYYRKQGNALASAGQNMLDKISPITDKNEAAAAFQGGSEDAIRMARQNANAAARPSYEAAQGAGQVMSPDLAQLAEQPAVKTAMDQARKAYQNLYRRPAPETPDFALWDLTKRKLDDAHYTASIAGERTDAMAVDSLRGDLVTHLDTAYPSYAQARATAAPGQQLASQLEDSGIGSVAGKTGDERARAIVAPAFNQSPQAISKARDAFTAAGRADEWNAGVRAYVQDAFDKASMSQQGLNPAMLRRQVWGNVDNRDAIKAALTPSQYDGFDNFMRTVEDTARTYPMNSLTTTRQNARGALAGAAESQGNIRALDTIAAVISPMRLANLGESVFGGTRRRALQGNMNTIVSHLFSPDGMQYLDAMSRFSPGSQRAVTATSQMMSRALPNVLGGRGANDTGQSPPLLANPLASGTAGP